MGIAGCGTHFNAPAPATKLPPPTVATYQWKTNIDHAHYLLVAGLVIQGRAQIYQIKRFQLVQKLILPNIY